MQAANRRLSSSSIEKDRNYGGHKRRIEKTYDLKRKWPTVTDTRYPHVPTGSDLHKCNGPSWNATRCPTVEETAVYNMYFCRNQICFMPVSLLPPAIRLLTSPDDSDRDVIVPEQKSLRRSRSSRTSVRDELTFPRGFGNNRGLNVVA